MQVLDKGKSTIMSTHVEASDAVTGKVICESVVTVVVRGVGGFGGKTKSTCEESFAELRFLIKYLFSCHSVQ